MRGGGVVTERSAFDQAQWHLLVQLPKWVAQAASAAERDSAHQTAQEEEAGLLAIADGRNADSALVAARACVRSMRLTTRVAGTCATTMKNVLMKKTTPISPGPTGVCAFANGERTLEKNEPPTITSTTLAAIRASKSRSRATARKPLPLPLADAASAGRGSGIATSTTSAKTAKVAASRR